MPNMISGSINISLSHLPYVPLKVREGGIYVSKE